MLTSSQRRDLLGLALLAIAAFLALSLLPTGALGAAGERWFPSGNIVGVLGTVIRHGAVGLLGAGAVLLPVLPAVGGAACFGWLGRERSLRWGALLLGFALLLPAAAGLIDARSGGLVPAESTADAAGVAAGWLGRAVAPPLVAGLGMLGSALLLFFLAIGLCVATIGWNPVRAAVGGAGRAAKTAGAAAGKLAQARKRPALGTDGAPPGSAPIEPDAPAISPDATADENAGVLTRALKRGRKARKRKPAKGERSAGKTADGVPHLHDPGDPESAVRPPLSLLSDPNGAGSSYSDEELDRLGQVLVETLATFKVDGKIAGRTTGPVVTQFEFVPAPGIKVNRIASLDADLALGLKAPSIRIVAPIPGKGAVGVEVPHPQPEVVHLRQILESGAFQRSRGKLPLALGKDLEGRPYVADLSRMPHLLIAGATGSGKSVCINTLITSLVYRYPPQQLRMLLIDPKMVELIMYEDLPHLRHPVVTDPSDAATVLKWAVMEMERRYALLSENGVRSLTEFNRRVVEGYTLRRPGSGAGDGDDEPAGATEDVGVRAANELADGDAETETQAETGGEADDVYDEGPLPYIVVVVDELADLMMAVQAEIERPLAKLAQKARAIGIHLIVATQRPSVNVITGLIKANFPSRIAFRVSSKVDSRTILDQNGADALLGNGDMLFLPPGQSDPVRIQGAFVDTEDTEQLMDWFREHGAGIPLGEDDILNVVREQEAEEAMEDVAEAVLEDRDALFRQAAELCIQQNQGSTSLLQRRLRVGYGRAARIVDQLHHAGILGPPDGSKPREVLVGLESLDNIIGD